MTRSRTVITTPERPGVPGSRRGLWQGTPPRLLLLLGSVTAAVAVIPLVYLIVRVFGAGLDRIIDVLWRTRTLDTVLTSAALVLVVTLACLRLLTAPARRTSRALGRGQR